MLDVTWIGIISTESASLITKLAGLFGNVKSPVNYRIISSEHYEELSKTNRVLGTGETTTSPTLEFSEKYEGYLVQVKVKRGTIKQLEKNWCRGQKSSRDTKTVSIIRQRYCSLERRVCKIQIRKKSNQYSLRKRSRFRLV